MHFLKMTVATVRTAGVAAVVDGNVVERDAILHPVEAGGRVPVLDCRRLNVADHLDRTVACLAAGYPTRVSACQFREPCPGGFA